MSTSRVLGEVRVERERQDAKWGEQNHADAIGWFVYKVPSADAAKDICEFRFKHNCGTWADVLIEELAEALEEAEKGTEAAEPLLRAELVQVAAVAVAWVEAIDRRRRARAAEVAS